MTLRLQRETLQPHLAEAVGVIGGDRGLGKLAHCKEARGKLAWPRHLLSVRAGVTSRWKVRL